METQNSSLILLKSWRRKALLAMALFLMPAFRALGQTYVAQVSLDGGTTWSSFYHLVDQGPNPGDRGAFSFANDHFGDVIIELLSDYDIDEPFTFNCPNAAIPGDSLFLTLRKSGDITSTHPVLLKNHEEGSMITFSPQFGGTLTVQGIDFHGPGQLHSSQENGGFFKITCPKASFDHCSFENSYIDDPETSGNPYPHNNGGYQAKSNGAAIAHYCNTEWDPTASYPNASLTITNCYFDECQTYGGDVENTCQGGAIYFCWYSHGTLTIEDSWFHDCYAMRYGGAFCVPTDYGSKVVVRRTTFNACTAGGGGAFKVGTNVECSSCTFMDCSASTGGAIAFDDIPTTARPQTLTSCTFSNCSATGYGGAIYFMAVVTVTGIRTVTNCYFDTCTAGGSGGAVYSQGGLEVDNSAYATATFVDCSATGGDSYGGAIYVANGSLAMKDTTIQDCAAHSGGGIALGTDAISVLDHVTITGCHANAGGAVFSMNESNSGIVLALKNGTSITGNGLDPGVTFTNAAGVYMTNGALTLGGTEIDNDNVTIKENATYDGKSSNLHLSGTNGELIRVLSNLTGEIYITNPGGIGNQFGVDYADNALAYVPSNVFKSDVTNRFAYRQYNDNQYKLYWDAMACKITDNSSNLLYIGGTPAVYKSLPLAFSDFASQTFTNALGASATPKNIEMLLPEYSLPSGITISSAVNVTLKTAEAGLWGPDTYYYPADADSTRCTIYRGSTANNTSMFKVNNSSATIRLNDIVIDGESDKGKYCTTNGCGFWIAQGAKLYMSRLTMVTGQEEEGNALIVNCWVSDYYALGGGAVYFDGTQGSYDMSYWHLRNCSVSHNTWINYNKGGGIYIKANNLTVSHSSFSNCSASCSGGAIYIADNSGQVSFTDCTFNNCSSTNFADDNHTRGGGGIYMGEGTSLSLHGCRFDSCECKEADAGAVFTYGVGTVLVDDYIQGDNIVHSSFTNCSANYHGGGCFIHYHNKANSSQTFINVTFENCFAGLKRYGCGGGYYAMHGNTEVVIQGCTFRNCHASYGGAFYPERDAHGEKTVQVVNCSFAACVSLQYNTTYGAGGSIYFDLPNESGSTVDTLIILGCDFNGAGTSGVNAQTGGAVYGAYGSLVVGDYQYDNGGVTVTKHTEIKNMSCYHSAAIHWTTGGTATFNNVTIKNCSAVNFGGALSLSNNNLAVIDGGEITGCNAGTKGGGVYVNANIKAQIFKVSGMVKIYGNTLTGSKDGTANNVHLTGALSQPITIDDAGLECGSKIGVTTDTPFSDDNNGSQRVLIATGSSANCLDAFRKGYFFDDSQTYKPYCFSYGNYSDNNIYLVKSWNNLANASGISINDSESPVKVNVNSEGGLAFIAKSVNLGHTYADTTIVLTQDLNLASTSSNDGKLWIPIGCAWDDCVADSITPFLGTFDGQGHTISGLTSYLPHKAMGLFGAVGGGGKVQNVFIEGGTITTTYVPESTETACGGGLVGLLDGGTVACSEFEGALTTDVEGLPIGGLVGNMASGTIHSSMAMANITGNNCTTGGLVGNLASGTLANSFSNPSITVSSGTPATGGLVGTNGGTVTNCYVRLRGTAPASGFGWLAGTNSGTITNSYIPAENSNYIGNSATVPSGCNTYTPTNLVNGKYGFGQNDQQVGTSTLVDMLNANATGTYAQWTRAMASPINDDYPVLKLGTNLCLGSKTGSNFIGYSANLNTLITAYNSASGGGDIYVFNPLVDGNNDPYAVTINTDSDVRIYIDENIGILQGNSNTLNARVGVTFDNSSGNMLGGAPYDWHMFSTALQAAPLGLTNSDEATHYYGYVVPDGALSLSADGYFPTNTPFTSMDFYCYSEPDFHWINFKRHSNDHWHEDEPHDQIFYTNETNLVQGKGYLLAIDQPTMLMADGVLTNAEVPCDVTATNRARKVKGINLIGNPYQSYLDFDAFANESANSGVGVYYILDADAQGYLAYTAGATPQPSVPGTMGVASRYIHPHQGFFVKVDADRQLKFTTAMRAATGEGSTFRDGTPRYPLVNLVCTDSQGCNDFATVELDRPEKGGGEKIMELHSGNASIWFHLDDSNWHVAFTTAGITEAPVRFKAYEDGVFTLRWNTQNADFSYLHLIDNLTGADIDMLAAEQYAFEGRTDDYLSRFKLVFGIDEPEVPEPVEGPTTFAFMMGDELVVNGKGTLQMFDVNGRCLMERTVCGTQTAIAMPKVSAGVYVLQLTDSSQTKVQKLIIR